MRDKRYLYSGMSLNYYINLIYPDGAISMEHRKFIYLGLKFTTMYWGTKSLLEVVEIGENDAWLEEVKDNA